MRLRRISAVFLLALVLQACSDKPPIPENKFVDFYIQLQLIDTQYGTNTALQKEKVDSLMRAYRIDRALVDSTLSWYGRKPERWVGFFTKVNGKFDQMRPEFMKPRSR